MLSHLFMSFPMSLFSRAHSFHHYHIFLLYTSCRVDKFLNDKIITTQDRGIRKYLICWTEKVPIDDTWLDRSEVSKIDRAILKQYESTFTSNSTELSSLQHEENNADMKPRIWHVFHQWRRHFVQILSGSRILVSSFFYFDFFW